MRNKGNDRGMQTRRQLLCRLWTVWPQSDELMLINLFLTIPTRSGPETVKFSDPNPTLLCDSLLFAEPATVAGSMVALRPSICAGAISVVVRCRPHALWMLWSWVFRSWMPSLSISQDHVATSRKSDVSQHKSTTSHRQADSWLVIAVALCTNLSSEISTMRQKCEPSTICFDRPTFPPWSVMIVPNGPTMPVRSAPTRCDENGIITQ